jgi:ABC-type nitrate/sulfonate/bicarbonate transport system substrate-binding protein
MKALLEACLWLDDPKHLPRAAQKLALPEYVGTSYETIKSRLVGEHNLGATKARAAILTLKSHFRTAAKSTFRAFVTRSGFCRTSPNSVWKSRPNSTTRAWPNR